MNLPSRGLRPSATTMRKNGAFLAPTRFMRIRTGISDVHRVGRNRQFQPSSANVLPRSKQSLEALFRVDKSCFRFFSVNARRLKLGWQPSNPQIVATLTLPLQVPSLL